MKTLKQLRILRDRFDNAHTAAIAGGDELNAFICLFLTVSAEVAIKREEAELEKPGDLVVKERFMKGTI